MRGVIRIDCPARKTEEPEENLFEVELETTWSERDLNFDLPRAHRTHKLQGHDGWSDNISNTNKYNHETIGYTSMTQFKSPT